MERFLKQYQSKIVGVLSGPDRVLFRGVLRSISYVQGLEIFLASIRVLNRDFMAYAERISKGIHEHAQKFAQKHGRPYEYVASSRSVQRGDRAKDRTAGRDRGGVGLRAGVCGAVQQRERPAQ